MQYIGEKLSLLLPYTH